MDNEHPLVGGPALPAHARAASASGGPARPDAAARRLRTRALWAGLLLVPATILAGILALTSENAGRCVGYGEGCGSAPGWLYLAALAVAAAAWIHALCTPDDSAPAPSRTVAFWTLIGAECVFLLLVVTALG
ncbi:hypothetical protein [Streptomyces vilmorinianum]|uniref:hypothetical protein n=1 Tax=Streptomyces vilmorinianum TaxID=3051092 RepID=UPI0010FB50A0|nr:hypothetical protein [Streptomyces vilmorinianum]